MRTIRHRGTYRKWGWRSEKWMWSEMDYFMVDESLMDQVGRMNCFWPEFYTDHCTKVMNIRLRKTNRMKIREHRARMALL